MYLKIIILYIFAILNGYSYENLLYDYLNNKNQTNFTKLESEFEKLKNREHKAKIAFILFNSNYSTTLNKKSYYSLYALNFYKGKDLDLLTNAYLKTIHTLYQQSNLKQAKRLLTQLQQKKGISAKNLEIIQYYTSLILLNEKKYKQAIKKLVVIYNETKKESFKKAIPKELARASLLHKNNLKLLSTSLIDNDNFKIALSEYTKSTPAYLTKNILLNNYSNKKFALLADIILKNSIAFEEPCEIIKWFKKHPNIKRKSNYQSYKHLINRCYLHDHNNKYLASFIEKENLKGEDRILKALILDSKNSCKESFLSISESQLLSPQQFHTTLSIINKHCPLEEIKKNNNLISSNIIKNEIPLSSNLEYINVNRVFFSNEIRVKLLKNITNQNIINFVWKSYTDHPKGLLQSLSINKKISSLTTRENILRIILTWENSNKVTKAFSHPSLAPHKELFYSLKTDTPLKKLAKNICQGNSYLEKESLLRSNIKNKNSRFIVDNISCFQEIIDENTNYQMAIINLWKEAPYKIKGTTKFLKTLNYIHSELETRKPVKWNKSYSQFINKKKNNDILHYRNLKLHAKKVLASNNISKKITSIKKMSFYLNKLDLNTAKPNAKKLINTSIDSTLKAINYQIKNKEQKKELIFALQNWRPSVD